MSFGNLQPERLRAMGFRSLGEALAPGWVALLALPSRRTGIVARLDDGYPVRTGGYGGWEDVPRPGRPAATHYVGPGALMLALPLILGDWRMGHRGSIDGDVEILERLSRQPASAPRGAHPPIIEVRGPVPHGGVKWVVDDLQWGEDGIRVGMQLARIRVTVVLRRYVEPDLVQIEPTRRRNPVRWHRVRDDEAGPAGLTRLVVRELDARGSREVNAAKRRVLQLNDLHDGNQVRSGMRLRLPS